MKEDERTLRAQRRKELRAELDADYSVTPEEGAALRARYLTEGGDTPEAYEGIKPEEFFDGAL